jgi:hypothetical protein
VIRIWTGAAAQLGTCDHCDGTDTPAQQGASDEAGGQVITAVTLHRDRQIVFLARFCEKHFLHFSDLVSDQVAALLYPAQKAQ